mgnify:CR=1 FL=1
MTSPGALFVCALLALSSAGCCKACGAVSDIAKEIKGPDTAEGERLVKERVTTDEHLRKRICGVDTSELKGLVVKKDSLGYYSIQGTPVEEPLVSASAASAPAASAPAASAVAAKADAGPSKSPVEPAKLLVCAAVVSIVWKSTEVAGKTTWKIQQLNMYEITTPGIEYKRHSADWD